MAHNLRVLDHLDRQLPELAPEDAGAFLRHITHDPALLGRQILTLLAHVAPAQEPYIAMSYGTREEAACLQIFVWPAGAATPIHDHTSWGAYHCVVGALREERYARLDAGDQPSTARLRKTWQRVWRTEDGSSIVGAYEQGIHRIANLSGWPAISAHLYGPRMGSFDGRDYDPTRDFVCDRQEFDDWMPQLLMGAANHAAAHAEDYSTL